MGETARPLAGLDGDALLRAWERAGAVDPALRGAAVLSVALPDLPVAAERLPVGCRDTLLLALRVGTFGAPLTAVADCPACGEAAEVAADGAALLAALPAPDPAGQPPDPVEVDGWRVRFRLADTLDLAAAARCADAGKAAALLVQRCLGAVTRNDVLTAEEPPPDVLAAVSARMEQADPAADLRLRTTCPACGACWSAGLDIAEFLWAELAAAAVGLLLEVDALAARYGWAEREILTMSPLRRRTYLDLP